MKHEAGNMIKCPKEHKYIRRTETCSIQPWSNKLDEI